MSIYRICLHNPPRVSAMVGMAVECGMGTVENTYRIRPRTYIDILYLQKYILEYTTYIDTEYIQ